MSGGRGGFDHDPTPEERRASLSYMLGFTDGLLWAMCHQEELPAMVLEILATRRGEPRPLIQSVTHRASELFDAAGAEPVSWADGGGIQEISQIKPDPDR